MNITKIIEPTKVNSVIGYIVQLSIDFIKSKSRTSQNFIEKSGFVPRRRLELPRLATYAPQAHLYTIPTPGLKLKITLKAIELRGYKNDNYFYISTIIHANS